LKAGLAEEYKKGAIEAPCRLNQNSEVIWL